MHSLSRFQNLSLREKWLFLQIYLWYFPLVICLKRLGLKKVEAYLARFSTEKRSKTHFFNEPEKMIEKLTYLVEAAAKYSPARPLCLARSLMLWAILRKYGVIAEIKIGVRKLESEFQAHAWVEYQGKVLNDQKNVGDPYSPFPLKVEPKV